MTHGFRAQITKKDNYFLVQMTEQDKGTLEEAKVYAKEIVKDWLETYPDLTNEESSFTLEFKNQKMDLNIH